MAIAFRTYTNVTRNDLLALSLFFQNIFFREWVLHYSLKLKLWFPSWMLLTRSQGLLPSKFLNSPSNYQIKTYLCFPHTLISAPRQFVIQQSLKVYLQIDIFSSTETTIPSEAYAFLQSHFVNIHLHNSSPPSMQQGVHSFCMQLEPS